MTLDDLDPMTALTEVWKAVKQSEAYRHEGHGEEAAFHVCATVDFGDLPFQNINLTEPKDEVARTVANCGWAIVRIERVGETGVRRVWFGDPATLGDGGD